MDGVAIELSDNIDKGIALRLKEIADVADEAEDAVALLQRTLNTLGGAAAAKATREVTALDKQIDALTKSQADLTKAFGRTTGAIEKNTAATTANTAELSKWERGARGAGKAGEALTGMAYRLGGAIGAYLSIGQLIDYSNRYSDLTSRIAVSVGPMEDAAATLDRIRQVAERSYQPIEQTAEGFLRNKSSLDALRVSQSDQLDMLETVNNALVVSATRGQRAESVMNAWSKAIALGTLRGDELNAVITGSDRLAKALADSMNVSVNSLRELGASGQITRKQLLGVTSQMEQLRAEAESMPATIADAWTRLQDNLMLYVGGQAEATGGATLLASSIMLIANNLDLLVPLAVGGAAAWLLWKPAVITLALITRGIMFLSAALAPLLLNVVRLTASLVAMAAVNPFTWMLAGATALAYGLTAIVFGVDGANERFKNLATNAGAAVKQALAFAGLTPNVDALSEVTGLTADALGTAGTAAKDAAAGTKRIGTEGQPAIAEAGKSAEILGKELKDATKDADELTKSLKRAADAAKALRDLKRQAAPSGNTSVGIPGYANGGSFRVGGKAGVDRNLVAFRASANERVDVLTPAQQRAQAREMQGGRGSVTIAPTFHISTPDPDSFKRSGPQIANDLLNVMKEGLRND